MMTDRRPSSRAGIRVAFGIFLFLVTGSYGNQPDLAFAHGPLDLFRPTTGPPGTRVRVDLRERIEEVLWNPRPSTLGNPALAEHPHRRLYRPDVRTISIKRPNRRGPLFFQIPDVPRGDYVVVIFDKSEGSGRNHYTWGTLTVTEGGSPLAMTGRPPPVATVLMAVALASLGMLFSRRSVR